MAFQHAPIRDDRRGGSGAPGKLPRSATACCGPLFRCNATSFGVNSPPATGKPPTVTVSSTGSPTSIAVREGQLPRTTRRVSSVAWLNPRKVSKKDSPRIMRRPQLTGALARGAMSSGRSRLGKSLADREAGQLDAVVDVEFVHQVAGMLVHRLDAEVHELGDFFFRQSAGDVAHHLDLPRRQL